MNYLLKLLARKIINIMSSVSNNSIFGGKNKNKSKIKNKNRNEIVKITRLRTLARKRETIVWSDHVIRSSGS